MKKFLCLAVLLMIFLAGSVLASDVAYVVQNSADSFVTAELTALGLTYDVIYESDVLTANFSEYGMILAGDDNFNSPEDIPVNEHKSLILNHYISCTYNPKAKQEIITRLKKAASSVAITKLALFL